MPGVRIRHETDRNAIRLTPLIWQPLPAPQFPCNLCKVHHQFKTLHIWIGPDGEAIVATGIWGTLQRIQKGFGMNPADGYTFVSEVKAPPPLKLGRAAERAMLDDRNRAQVVYNKTQLEGE